MKRLPLFILFLSVVILTLVTCVKEEPVIYGSISGIVKDSDSKKPLSEVTVQLQPGGVSRMTGDDGAFSFVELEPGSYKVLFTRDSYEDYEQSVTVKANVESSIQISLDPIVPELQVSTNTLDFGKEIQTLSFDITNKGKGKLSWTIKHEVDWLKCTPSEGMVTKESQSVSVIVDRSRMESGAYVGSIVVTSNGGSQTILVSCSNNKVNLEVTPSELDFGSLTNSMQLTLKNVGKGTLHYTASSANKWLTLDKSSGTITDVDYLNAIVSRDNLSAGNFTSSILFTVDSGSLSVPVKMSVAVNEKPTVTVEEAYEVTYNSVILYGTIVSPGSAAIKRYGFCWKEGEGDPTIEDNFTNLGDCSSPQAFESYISNLKSDYTYSYRAYAENSVGLVYSERTRNFTTLPLPTIPTVVTGAIAEMTSSEAKVNGTIGSLGYVDKILHYGHVWALEDNPTLDNGKFSDLGERTQTGTYTSTITNLDANTSYYYRAYATNEKGTAYGETQILTTYKGKAEVVTTDPTNIIHNAATVGGEITDTGGNEIIEKGVCWGTYPQPDFSNNYVIADEDAAVSSQRKTITTPQRATTPVKSSKFNSRSSNAFSANIQKIRQAIPGGTFSCRIEGLEKQTTYYARAYVRTEGGYVYYGNDKRFTTTLEVTLPTLSVVTATNVKPTTAEVTATIINNGNAEITSCGFCYGKDEDPTVNDAYVECDPNSAALGKTLENLEQNTKYYVRAFALNSMGISYSPVSTSFLTSAIGRPQLSSVLVDNIGRTTATASSSIISDGNSTITECGIIWSTTANPTTSDNNGKYQLAADNLSVKLTGLPEKTTIHVRAYAINAIGTGYSDDMPFQTTDVDNDVWDGTIATKYGGGMASESNPILINSADQLALLASNVNNGTTYDGVYFRLMTNISLNNLSWTPIGNGTRVFAGHFDGNDMMVTGLNNTKGMGGLFGNNSGSIKNVKVSGTSTGSDNVGGIAATNSGVIENCISSVSVTSNGVAGGIAGTSSGIIKNCINQGTITSTGEKVGGIAGYSDKGTFTENKNSASISGSDYVGGICGDYSISYSGSYTRKVHNNANYGRINATNGLNGAGGIIGFATVTNTYTASSNLTTELSICNNYNVGDIFATVSGGICGAASISGTGYYYSYSSNWYQTGKLTINNCISERAGLLNHYSKTIYHSGGSYYKVSAEISYGNSYWLYDIVNNIGQEEGVGSDHFINAWYMHDAAGCYLKYVNPEFPEADIVTLLNNWVNSNGATEYKKWKYETIDGYAVPVFDE